MAKFALLLAGLIFLTVPVKAAEFSGDYLLQMCMSDDKGKELARGGHIACQSYIAGVMDYHNLIRSMGTAPSVDFCVPDGVGLTQLQQKVAAYLYKHKKQHGAFIASPGVALALYNYYPCGKKR